MALDPWSRVQYRRATAWPDRIRREWPFLERILRAAPARVVIDLGCGTGEHARHLAASGFDVVGIDASPSMIDAASEEALPPSLQFVNADIADVGVIDVRGAGSAICLGNTLPHLDHDDLRRLAQGLSALLPSGAPVVLQVLNYERIRAKKIRALPIDFRPDDEGGEVVHVRLMDARSDGTVIFTPVTLRYRPDDEPPVEVVQARRVRLLGWTWVELWDVFSAAGFDRFDLFGGFDGSQFRPAESADLLAVLRR